ncbi:hypothetical protein JTE90_005538 [Oedothorax gibbosus]|uniref:Uncharacterized protein n=1 Tax=Oedothorax gibbosus TaxID=931172 RepID=A0AAV6VC07_9ARAC|nr:hypothetical protein JTE90_005538 [Oedothorax gibbosus]
MLQLTDTLSDSDAPSPLPSPIFARCSPARGTVARKCREFYLKRLERTASMQKRWSICEVPDELGIESGPDGGVETPELVVGDNAEFEGGYPLRKCRSSFDIAMDSLRKEIVSWQISFVLAAPPPGIISIQSAQSVAAQHIHNSLNVCLVASSTSNETEKGVLRSNKDTSDLWHFLISHE